ncbi:MAG: hypothetical protein CMM35_08985 [Rhodospirillaceae bacterium]|jgi:hypothetical protein|nr:hypothetical protein [Rhodospirillaceae bacterium]
MLRNEPTAYSVVWPRGEKTQDIAPLATRLDSLEGKTVGFVWDYLFRGDEIFPVLEEGLKQRYPKIKFVSYDEFGSTHGGDEHAVIAGLSDKIKMTGTEAVISGMGC